MASLIIIIRLQLYYLYSVLQLFLNSNFITAVPHREEQTISWFLTCKEIFDMREHTYHVTFGITLGFPTKSIQHGKQTPLGGVLQILSPIKQRIEVICLAHHYAGPEDNKHTIMDTELLMTSF
ncbi:hypothetical protein ACJX0J_035678 [Zea mays]